MVRLVICNIPSRLDGATDEVKDWLCQERHAQRVSVVRGQDENMVMFRYSLSFVVASPNDNF